MPKQTTVVDVSSFSTDAKFRTWGLAQSTAMQACGLIKTADTGQINWTTVVKPTAASTQAGYEIYRFNDSLQATAPVFIRVGYGTAGAANGPSTWVTVGTGTDGAGTITGINTGAIAGYAGPASTNAALPGMFTHTTDGYCLMNFGLGTNTPTQPWSNAGIWVIDRVRNSSTAAATSQGVGLWSVINATANNFASYALDFSTVTAYTTSRAQLSGSLSTTYSLATASVVPLGKTYIPTLPATASMGLISYYSADISGASTFTATPFGSTARTYYALANSTNASWGGANSAGSTSIYGAVLWED